MTELIVSDTSARLEDLEKEQRREALVRLVACMHEGQSWREAARTVGVHVSQSTAYRLSRAVRERGEAALQDGRHGHPIKLRGAVRTFLEEQCQQAPHLPSSTLQVELQERFHLEVSISQINRVRAAFGFSRDLTSQKQEKKRK